MPEVSRDDTAEVPVVRVENATDDDGSDEDAWQLTGRR